MEYRAPSNQMAQFPDSSNSEMSSNLSVPPYYNSHFSGVPLPQPTQKSSWGWVVIGGLILAGLGVGIYFLVMYLKSTSQPAPASPPHTPSSTPSPTSTTPASSPSSASPRPAPVSSPSVPIPPPSPSTGTCSGNGTLSASLGIATCVCNPGTAGPACQYTRANTCNNRGNPTYYGKCTNCDSGYLGDHCETKTVFKMIRDKDPVRFKILNQDIVNGAASNYELGTNGSWDGMNAFVTYQGPNSDNPGLSWRIESGSDVDSWPNYYLRSDSDTAAACLDQSVNGARPCVAPYAWNDRQGWYKYTLEPVGDEKDGLVRFVYKKGQDNASGNGQCYMTVYGGGWNGSPAGDLYVHCPNDDKSQSTKSLWKIVKKE